MSSLLEKSPLTKEKPSRFSFRNQLRQLGLGSILLLASSVSGCNGCNNPLSSSPSETVPTGNTDPLRFRSLLTTPDAGVDAGTARSLPEGAVPSTGVVMPANQGTPEFRAEVTTCYGALPSHICLADESTTDAAGRTTDLTRLAQFPEAYGRENFLQPFDTNPANDRACLLADSRGRATWTVRFEHAGAIYTCDFNSRNGAHLRSHYLVPCVRHPMSTRSTYPCAGSR